MNPRAVLASSLEGLTWSEGERQPPATPSMQVSTVGLLSVIGGAPRERLPLSVRPPPAVPFLSWEA
jgi:hypothetical protein